MADEIPQNSILVTHCGIERDANTGGAICKVKLSNGTEAVMVLKQDGLIEFARSLLNAIPLQGFSPINLQVPPAD